MRTHAYKIVKVIKFYEWECNNLCIDTHTPQVAKRDNGWRKYRKRVERRYVYKLYGVLGEILYRHNVVGGVVNCTNDIYGGRTHSACRYRWHKRLWRI